MPPACRRTLRRYRRKHTRSLYRTTAQVRRARRDPSSPFLRREPNPVASARSPGVLRTVGSARLPLAKSCGREKKAAVEAAARAGAVVAVASRNRRQVARQEGCLPVAQDPEAGLRGNRRQEGVLALQERVEAAAPEQPTSAGQPQLSRTHLLQRVPSRRLCRRSGPT